MWNYDIKLGGIKISHALFLKNKKNIKLSFKTAHFWLYFLDHNIYYYRFIILIYILL